MNHIIPYKLFESNDHYEVVIEWEHGDADGNTLQRYPFKDEDEMDSFLQFIYELRHFIPHQGYGNAGHFNHRHEERKREWVNKIDKKYNNRFGSFVPNDRKYSRDGSGYTASVNSIWVEIDGTVLNIVWEKALKTNIIDLPKIGDTIKTDIGHISYYGPKMWGRTDISYWGYNDFKHWDEDHQCKTCNGQGWIKDYSKSSAFRSYENERCPDCKGEQNYSKIDPVVTDCKIQLYDSYKRDKWKTIGDEDVLESSYITHHDYTSFHYILLCEFAGAYITADLPNRKFIGFDPKFDSKFHYAKYGTNDFYLVR